jgi:hypothetical protein
MINKIPQSYKSLTVDPSQLINAECDELMSKSWAMLSCNK